MDKFYNNETLDKAFAIIKGEIKGENEVKQLGLNEAQINDLVADIVEGLETTGLFV